MTLDSARVYPRLDRWDRLLPSCQVSRSSVLGGVHSLLTPPRYCPFHETLNPKFPEVPPDAALLLHSKRPAERPPEALFFFPARGAPAPFEAPEFTQFQA